MAEALTFFWKHRLSQWHHAPFVIGGVGDHSHSIVAGGLLLMS